MADRPLPQQPQEGTNCQHGCAARYVFKFQHGRECLCHLGHPPCSPCLDKELRCEDCDEVVMDICWSCQQPIREDEARYTLGEFGDPPRYEHYDCKARRDRELDASLRVLRQKVEAAPWCPEVPSRANGTPFAPGQYMEGHLKVMVPGNDLSPLGNVLAVGTLRGLARTERAHLSSTPQSPGVYFVTQRAAIPAEDFTVAQLNLSMTLAREGFKVLKSIVEFTVMDTNIGIDGSWGALP